MNFFKKKKPNIIPKMTLNRLALFLTGIFLYTISFNLVFLPLKIMIGGISGLSILINYFFQIDIIIFILIESLILLVMAFIFLKKSKAMNYIVGALALPVFIKLTSYTAMYLKIEEADKLIMVFFGGILAGLGTGLIHKSGFLTTEKDVLADIVFKKFKITRGKTKNTSTIIVLLLGGLISSNGYNFSNVMYAIIAAYSATIIAERVIIGISSNKTFYIFTEEVEKVKNYIIEGFDTSLTVMKATGAYSKDKKTVLMCVIQTRDYFKIKEGLRLIDQNSFFVATDAYETSYKKIEKEE